MPVTIAYLPLLWMSFLDPNVVFQALGVTVDKVDIASCVTFDIHSCRLCLFAMAVLPLVSCGGVHLLTPMLFSRLWV